MSHSIGYGYVYGTSGRAMHHEERNSFDELVRLLVLKHNGTVHFQGRGVGVYDGNEEPSGIIVFDLNLNTLVPWSDPTGDRLHHTVRTLVRNDIAHLAETFGQECIALTEGKTWLVDQAAHATKV